MKNEPQLNVLANRLESLLAKPGFSAADAARAAKVAPAYITALKKGKKSRPSLEVMIPLANYFGVNVNWLLTGEGDELREDSPDQLAEETVARYTTKRSQAYDAGLEDKLFRATENIRASLSQLPTASPDMRELLLGDIDGEITRFVEWVDKLKK